MKDEELFHLYTFDIPIRNKAVFSTIFLLYSFQTLYLLYNLKYAQNYVLFRITNNKRDLPTRPLNHSIDVYKRQAQAYHNEEGVGNAISKCGVPREELFITTKVWISNAGYDKAKASIDESLRKLQSDYVDLLLIHQPFGDYYGTYRAMEEAYKAGKIRAIGVSNFYPDRFVDLAEFCEITPAVNQVETHVFNQQVKLQEVMKEYGTRIMSWGPFAEGRNDFFTNSTLQEIGKDVYKRQQPLPSVAIYTFSFPSPEISEITSHPKEGA